MVGSKLVITLLCGLVWRSTSAQCKSRTLTLDEYFSMADSELGSAFCEELSHEECATKLSSDWDELNSAEYDRGIKDYEEHKVWYPFALCHIGPNLTGNQRKKRLLESIENSTTNVLGVSIDPTDEINESNVAIMENTADRLCAIIRLPSPIACDMADGDNIMMQPMHRYLKMGPDTILSSKNLIEGGNATLPEPVFQVTFCMRARNEVGISDEAEDITQELVDYVLSESNDTACKDTYENHLNVSFAPGDPDLAIDPDMLKITFDRTDATELDKNCSIKLLEQMADLPAVCFLELEEPSRVDNEHAQYITQSGSKNYRPLFDVGIKGNGQVVAVSDSGLDMKHCFFDQTSKPTSIQNNNQRKVIQYIPYADDIDDPDGHGSHVCATIAGHKSSNGVNEEYAPDNGVALDALIAFLDIGETGKRYLCIPSDTDVLNTGRNGDYDENAHLHSASWGTPVDDLNRNRANGYTSRAKNFDKYMYQNPDFLILVAAGNDGRNNQANSVGTPATAKSIISVGSHIDDVNHMNEISSFSSRGPTQDGRIKPEVLAPGQSLTSAKAGSGCGLSQKSGTSMATPATSGSAALVRQYFQEGWYPQGEKGKGDEIKATGALVKSVLVNGAQWVKGVVGGGKVEPYDNNQGFGRISLTHSLYVAGKTQVLLDVDEGVIGDGEEKVYNKTIVTAGGCEYPEFRATLVWTDEPGVTSSKHNLVNDLDLLVTRKRNGTADINYHPNGKMIRDSVNPTERVIVNNLEDGDVFEITVTGTNLASDEQSYAIAMTGCFNVSDVSYTAPAGGPSSGAKNSKMMSISIIDIVVGAAILAFLV